MIAEPLPLLAAAARRATAPRKPLTVSQWADLNRRLSSKGSAEPGRWRTDRNPPLREPMDCMSARSTVREAVLMFPIQFGKTEVEVNCLGYWMTHAPGPIMTCLPGEVSLNKWVGQKLNPMLDETPAVREVLTSVKSRDGANTRTFKDFEGGQLWLEHAGSPKRLKSNTVRYLLVDELTEFAASLTTGDDPVDLLDGRTSAFPVTYKRLYVSTPGLRGVCRTAEKWEKSDRRRYQVPCPHCGEMQPLEWAALQWSPDARSAWYVCRECGAIIDEHHKAAMIAAGRWVPENPEAHTRGYHINCLYYPIGLGPRWADLARMWLDAQNDPARLKTFINDRLAESWEDPSMRSVKHNLVADRAEPYRLRTAPAGVCWVTAGVDTQDNRLAVQITGWGVGMSEWCLDYVELPGDPQRPEVWVALTELLNAPIEHAGGTPLTVMATAIDAGGHRTEAVKHYVRQRLIRRPMCIFGAVPNNAPVLSRPKAQDVTWNGKTDKRGVMIWHVGTVAIKHALYARLGTDADLDPAHRTLHFSEDLPPEYFTGLVSERFDPRKGRFINRRGARNEPLDTKVYAHAAAHHPELRLHRKSRAQWQQRLDELAAGQPEAPATPAAQADPRAGLARPAQPRRRGGFAKRW